MLGGCTAAVLPVCTADVLRLCAACTLLHCCRCPCGCWLWQCCPWHKHSTALALLRRCRRRLLPLLRFHTSKSGDKLASLADYVARMKEGQKQIYYLVGE